MLGECAAAAATAAAEAEEDREELVLKPMGDSFTKPINSALLLTCEVAGADENANYDIKWLGTNNREIIDRSGRSVRLPRTFILLYDLSITTATSRTTRAGRSINKLQNGAIPSVPKVGKIRNRPFVGNLILNIHKLFSMMTSLL